MQKKNQMNQIDNLTTYKNMLDITMRSLAVNIYSKDGTTFNK